jgi:hypothetical protein
MLVVWPSAIRPHRRAKIGCMKNQMTGFRAMNIAFGVMAVVMAVAAMDITPDGASLSVRLLAVSAAMGPWLVASVIAWATGVVVTTRTPNTD